MHHFVVLWSMELRLAFRRPGDSLLMLGFALVALTLLTIAAEAQALAQLAPGFIWVVMLFSLLLRLDSVWRKDAKSGRLALLLTQPIPCWLLVLAKAFGLWCRAGLPWLVFAPMAGVMLQLPWDTLPALLISLLLGTPSLCLLATVGGSLTLGARQPTLLVMMIVLPLLIPVLVFAVLGVTHEAQQTASQLWLGVCLGLSFLSVPIGAFALQPPPERV